MSNRKKLTFYTNIPTPYQLSFFRELSLLFDLKIVLYSLSENNRSWNLNFDDSYQVKILNNNFIARLVQKKIVDFHFSWRIFSTVANDDSDYVIVGGSYWAPNGALALLISRIMGKKVAYFSEPLFPVKGAFKVFIKRTVLKILNFSCDALFCIGRKAEVSFREFKVKVPAFIVPYNIDVEEYKALDKSKVDSYKKKFEADEAVILLSSGALIPRKGMDILIAAIKKIESQKLRLIILGDGPERERLQALAEDDSRVIFAGFQKPEETPYFFAAADIFVFASRYDGWAVVVNEAIAAGLPVICSDAVGAGVELITNREDGILCRSEDEEEFRKAINDLVENVAERMRITERSKLLIPKVSSKYYAEYVYRIFANLSTITVK